jgi:hypothetical protein
VANHQNGTSGLDRWSLGHLAFGLACGTTAVPVKAYLLTISLWEVLHPGSSRESILNQATDLSIGVVGFQIGLRLLHPKIWRDSNVR